MILPPKLRVALSWGGVLAAVAFYAAVTSLGGFGYSTENRPLPALSAQLLGSGADFSRASLGGKPAIINVWSPSCAPCVQELPSLDELAQRYQGRLSVVALTAWGTPAQAAQLVHQQSLNHLPVLVGGEDFLNALDVSSVPTTFFVRADGTIVARQTGRRGERFFRSEAEKLLSAR